MAAEFRPMPGASLYAQRLDRSDLEFVVAAMFTANIKDRANRLRDSLEAAGLNYALYQVPSVHRSISTKGGDDIAFCKPNFIRRMMEELQRPLLYLDADIVVRKFPSKIQDIARAGADFAIYNWFADTANDAYRLVTLRANGVNIIDRFYQFSHNVDLSDPTQLMCCGAVQYYNNSRGSRQILASWMRMIDQYPDVADDELLDYAFNFLAPSEQVKAVWLEKEYCRYLWWIHVCPVIDHPDVPALADAARSFSGAAGRERFHLSRLKQHPSRGPFPRDCLIDVKEKCFLRITRDAIIPTGKFDNELWLEKS